MHDEMLDVPGASRSVLDQVDEYLHEDGHHGEGDDDDHTLQGRESTRSSSSTHWGPDAMEDLDRLSHSLFVRRDGERAKEEAGAPGIEPLSIPNKGAEGGVVRPDMVFSPISSPLVMPTRSTSLGTYDTPFMLPQAGTGSGPNTTTTTPFLNGSMASSSTTSLSSLRRKSSKPGAVSQFSPLSSPALTAIDQAPIVNFALPESTITSLSKVNSGGGRAKKKHYSSATAGIGAKISKNSPRIKPAAASSSSRRQYAAEQFKNSSPVLHTDASANAWDDAIFRLPESSIGDRAGSKWHNDEPTPKSSSSGGGAGATSSPESRMTPAALANYPKVILPSTSKPAYRNDESISPKELGPANSPGDGDKVLRATESPVIKPTLYHHHHHHQQQEPLWKPNGRTSLTPKIDEVQEPRRAACRPANRKTVSSSSLPGGNGSSDDGELSKKEVHKVAEQGRRNRLNSALTDLSSLLPPELKESIPIPSKATTVELACTYIRQLLATKNASNKA
ncbi:hypothetical protein HG536_0C04400 [Torulaspora globosa]|uniref:BHLH domain-containing protein n=1 Tax=Torulaspora globosa TaxID=48254 RepID=A0A7G3ZFI5_9SACH|nr:uncharacterized protein HG536_0C04400 [Torulaspora globosa]QLL32271.1 hypothetical protein HG536_0C04400 [Torulaspora globosa]